MDIIIQRDGLKLTAKYEEAGKSIVVMSHGFTADLGYKEDSNYKVLSELLNKEGYSTLRYDFNGHGKSDGTQEDMTVMNEVHDLFAVLQYVQKLGYKDIYLLGHSQGGVVSSMVAGYYHDLIKGVVLMAPAATLKDDAIKGTCMGVTYDPQNVPEVVVLPIWRLGSNYIRIAQTLPIYEVASQYKGPVCLIHGLADMIVDPIASKRYHEVYANSTLHLIEGENHNIKEKRDECFKIAIDFINSIEHA